LALGSSDLRGSTEIFPGHRPRKAGLLAVASLQNSQAPGKHRRVDPRRPTPSWSALPRPHLAASDDHRRRNVITLGTFAKTGTAFQGSILRRDFAGSIDIVPAGGGTAVSGKYRVFADGALVGSA